MSDIVVVVEAEADARIACALADRLLLDEGPDWLQGQSLTDFRHWSGLEEGSAFTKWTSIDDLFGQFPRLRFRRSTAGEKKQPYYATARKAIILAPLLRPQTPNALILMCDLDSQKERRDGLIQARDENQDKPLTLVLATPNPKREAWVLNGFVCENDYEQAELEAIRQEVNFDPCFEAERLRYASKTARVERNPKEILRRLTSDDYSREERCWTVTPLATLRQRGANTHLSTYLDEVRERLLPLF